MNLLNVENLQVEIGRGPNSVKAVRGVSFSLAEGEFRALVGESGSGKSITGLSLLDLLPSKSVRRADRFQLENLALPNQHHGQWRKLRGNRLAMIFQNPMTALDPTQKVGWQIAEPLCIHRGLSRRQAWQRAIELMERLAITDAEKRAHRYPFEFSGGMLQRVMIAMAIACEPQILIADEPTTALDVGVQQEVLGLLNELRESRGTAILFITHDLGVVAKIADSVSVMYAGQVVEQGPVETFFTGSTTKELHPYSKALLAAVPDLSGGKPLQGIAGQPPDLRRPPSGCGFAARCSQRMEICDQAPELFHDANGDHRCWRWHEAFQTYLSQQGQVRGAQHD
ncbi:ABC transporter ATP-binding protein [Spongiibacter sp. KMU-158]|uniref:ABC-type dipeptide transporter n=1 Tax=Spongiibacter pelagi TaxID=2760804 RepID=A0A927C2W8_9GAMM|nr:ABC transporter ATP-binding protein [Spongiibacter pelagi]MBD2858490.1 ABC transporter ATP-binding protein [Spongiibacter pelagi]